MEKAIKISAVVLCLGVIMVLIGSVLSAITWGSGGFNPTTGTINLQGAIVNLGWLATIFSGVVLTACTVSNAITGAAKK